MRRQPNGSQTAGGSLSAAHRVEENEAFAWMDSPNVPTSSGVIPAKHERPIAGLDATFTASETIPPKKLVAMINVAEDRDRVMEELSWSGQGPKKSRGFRKWLKEEGSRLTMQESDESLQMSTRTINRGVEDDFDSVSSTVVKPLSPRFAKTKGQPRDAKTIQVEAIRPTFPIDNDNSPSPWKDQPPVSFD